MGRAQAEAFAGLVADGTCSLRAALEYHLVCNHFPPMSRDLIPVAEEAIKRANQAIKIELMGGVTRDGNVRELNAHRMWRHKIKLPECVNGSWTTVTDAVEGMHLESFLDAG